MLQNANISTSSAPPFFYAESIPAEPEPAHFNAALHFWEERQQHVEALNALVAAYNAANDLLPDWAKSGPRLIDHEGRFCGADTGWPLDTSVMPPKEGSYRVVRPSTFDAKRDFDFFVDVFGCPDSPHYPAMRAKARANMRRRILQVVARLRERARLYDQLRLIELDRQITAESLRIVAAEDALRDLHSTPDKAAALLMAQLGIECDDSAFASGNGYDGTMAMAATALEALLPNLSGTIRDHAAFFVANSALPFSQMPFRAA